MHEAATEDAGEKALEDAEVDLRATRIDALVDEASMESFTASDRPSFWAREADETKGAPRRDQPEQTVLRQQP